jgi:hypothetical protein
MVLNLEFQELSFKNFPSQSKQKFHVARQLLIATRYSQSFLRNYEEGCLS